MVGLNGKRGGCFDPRDTPITLALFGSESQDSRNISGVAVCYEDGDHVFNIEFSYQNGTTPLRLGVDGVEMDLVIDVEVSRLSIDCANGEYIRSINAVYRCGRH